MYRAAFPIVTHARNGRNLTPATPAATVNASPITGSHESTIAGAPHWRTHRAGALDTN